MDIGSEFDDDFFEKPKEREGSEPTNYEAKFCVPLKVAHFEISKIKGPIIHGDYSVKNLCVDRIMLETYRLDSESSVLWCFKENQKWYMETQGAEKDTAEVLIALKHQADFHYFSKNYAKATETYEKCLQLVPPSNNTWKREFMENLSRSYLHLGDADKALEWGLKLHESSFSADQKVVSMNLLATVCHKLGKYKEELEALHCCIQSHKSCPEFWLRLGLCYAGLFKIDLPGCSLLKQSIEEDPDPCCAFKSKSACQSLKPETCPPSFTTECAIASSSSSHTSEPCSTKENENTFKCEICTLGIQIVSSCLIHTRALIDSGGPNPLGMERDEIIKDKIATSLKYMEVDQSFIDVASTMLGTDFLSTRVQDNMLHESQDNSVTQQPECILDKLKGDKND